MTDHPTLSVVERYRRLLKTFQELGTAANSDLLLNKIVFSASHLCDADAAWILIPDRNKEYLSLESGCFDNQSLNKGLSITTVDSLEGWVYSHQHPVLINGLQQYDNHYGSIINLHDVRFHSILSVPLKVKTLSVGVLEVVNKRPVDFSPLDQEILVSFAYQAAIFIDNNNRYLQSDLLTELVHELHTPLASLNTALYLLQRPDLPEKKREQISQMIQAEFLRLTDLTTSYLDYARFESGRAKFKPSTFDLCQLLKDSVDIMQMQTNNKDIKIYLDLPPQPLVITADRDRIKQVIINLINNACKYSPKGGRILVTSGTSPTGIFFNVQDNGQGIPAEYIPKLFERFYRVPTQEKKVRGTGLGLTICRQIVEGHKGKIEVESTVGVGSTFTVHLPLECEFMPHQVVSTL
jgi:signal transduction histidine kinase